MLQVLALQDVFGPETKGFEVLKHFDLAISNSGGSIVLGGLCSNMKLSDMRILFESLEKRQSMFKGLTFRDKSWAERGLKMLSIGPKYKTEDKLTGLIDNLKSGKKKISEVGADIAANNKKTTDIVICGYDYHRERGVFFRSNLKSRAFGKNIGKAVPEEVDSDNVLLAEAIHASSNAPINYFQNPAKVKHPQETRLYWDGAVGGYNNPVLAGVVEAVVNGTPLTDIRVLSIGTGATVEPLSYTDKQGVFTKYAAERLGFTDEIEKMSTSIVADPPDSASFIAISMMNPSLRPTSSFVRLNPVIQPYWTGTAWESPQWFTDEQKKDANSFKEVVALGLDAIEEHEIKWVKQLGAAWLENRAPNQPIRANSVGGCILGHPTFAEAKQALLEWLVLDLKIGNPVNVTTKKE